MESPASWNLLTSTLSLCDQGAMDRVWAYLVLQGFVRSVPGAQEKFEEFIRQEKRLAEPGPSVASLVAGHLAREGLVLPPALTADPWGNEATRRLEALPAAVRDSLTGRRPNVTGLHKETRRDEPDTPPSLRAHEARPEDTLFATPLAAEGQGVAGIEAPGYQVLRLVGMNSLLAEYEAIVAGEEGRRVLIQMPHRSDDETNLWFERVSELAGRLSHPGIPRRIASGSVGGRSYLVLPSRPEENLIGLVRRRGPLSAGEASRIVRGIAEALDYAHDLDVVHGHLQPRHVLISTLGCVTITGFGEFPPPGGPVGNLRHLAPEQLKSPGETTPAVSGAPTASERIRGSIPPERVGRFEVRRTLGEGAFGKVYEAHDPKLDRAVALKVAKLDRGDAEQRVRRFLREAKAAANLRHPGIVPLYEFGEEDSRFYIASAFIRGRTLQEEIAARKQSGSPDLDWCMRIGRSLAEALGYAHSQGIVHRDVKPANVLTDEKGEPMLTDFGLASRQDDAEQLTHQGQILGTPLYMSAEQARGEGSVAEPASDQYSLGVMLYEMVVGRPLFEGTPELVMFHHQDTEPTSPRKRNPSITRDLETICLKMLEKDPSRRYADCRAVGEDLRRCMAGEPIHARKISPLERAGRWTRRNPLSALLLAAVVVSLILGTAISLAFAVRAENQAKIAQNNETLAKTNELRANTNAEIDGKVGVPGLSFGPKSNLRGVLNGNGYYLLRGEDSFEVAGLKMQSTQFKLEKGVGFTFEGGWNYGVFNAQLKGEITRTGKTTFEGNADVAKIGNLDLGRITLKGDAENGSFSFASTGKAASIGGFSFGDSTVVITNRNTTRNAIVATIQGATDIPLGPKTKFEGTIATDGRYELRAEQNLVLAGLTMNRAKLVMGSSSGLSFQGDLNHLIYRFAVTGTVDPKGKLSIAGAGDAVKLASGFTLASVKLAVDLDKTTNRYSMQISGAAKMLVADVTFSATSTGSGTTWTTPILRGTARVGGALGNVFSGNATFEVGNDRVTFSGSLGLRSTGLAVSVTGSIKADGTLSYDAKDSAGKWAARLIGEGVEKVQQTYEKGVLVLETVTKGGVKIAEKAWDVAQNPTRVIKWAADGKKTFDAWRNTSGEWIEESISNGKAYLQTKWNAAGIQIERWETIAGGTMRTYYARGKAYLQNKWNAAGNQIERWETIAGGTMRTFYENNKAYLQN
ncbi:MAG: protein kinase, partial [Gemmataceae bacterium]|nr:protein kinase [Gemmataceae bacterium]